jgi:DNA-binding IclR family transcriptional regulator
MRTKVQSIARAAAILRALEGAPDGLGLGRLAKRVGLPKSTVHRIAGALVEEELLSQSPDGEFRLGGGIARLAAAGREALADRLRPVLLELRRDLEETVDLAVPDGTAVRFVDQVPGPHRLRAASAVGEAFPLHCTANGKAILAAMPTDEAAKLLPERLPRHTAATIVSREELLAELAEVRDRGGVAFDHEEHSEGISAAGIAVVGETGPVAAISVPVPTQRFAGREQELSRSLRGARGRANRLAR